METPKGMVISPDEKTPNHQPSMSYTDLRRSTRKSIKIINDVILSASTKRRKKPQTRKETIIIPKFELNNDAEEDKDKKVDASTDSNSEAEPSKKRKSKKKSTSNKKNRKQSSSNSNSDIGTPKEENQTPSADSGKGTSEMNLLSNQEISGTSKLEEISDEPSRLSTKRKSKPRKGSLKKETMEKEPNVSETDKTELVSDGTGGSGKRSPKKRKSKKSGHGTSDVDGSETSAIAKCEDTPESANQELPSAKERKSKSLVRGQRICPESTPEQHQLLLSAKRRNSRKSFVNSRMTKEADVEHSPTDDINQTLGITKLMKPSEKGRKSLVKGNGSPSSMDVSSNITLNDTFEIEKATPDNSGDQVMSSSKERKSQIKEDKDKAIDSPTADIYETLGVAMLEATPEKSSDQYFPSVNERRSRKSLSRKSKESDSMDRSTVSGSKRLSNAGKGIELDISTATRNGVPKLKVNDITLNDTLGLSSMVLHDKTPESEENQIQLENIQTDPRTPSSAVVSPCIFQVNISELQKE